MTETPSAHVLITGARRGIGKAAASALLEAGATLACHATRTEPGIAIAGDFSEPGTAADTWRQALELLGGRIDILVNNAGVFEASSIDQSDEAWLADFERTMRINLTASAELCRLAVRHFQEIGGGRIVNVASRAAYRGDSPDHWHYAASKGGMVAMTKTIARGYAAQNILAFTICPGFTMTGMAEDYLESRGGEKLLRDIPLGRVATPEEVAETIRFCALDAPPSMTGAVLDVNGASFVR
ncbi:SDR family NAD(P)-dependent oxidoreductase [Parasphingopyxis marina]|uniref:SDR family oxidoreductase n=1 Tax=Parasphingopyxis marina TaxID=2761622 RepID=A0A842I273_9SPHN|nr:SDR family oxidoreductase [Parasphingopyxis marina]MBC2778809.1 SDR family oxidoreductase [Parasphingopyxis marina]